jgi:hypothetical protein
MKCETLYAGTYTALAGRLGEDRNSIARALAEPDAPQKRKRGWVVCEIESFMFLRRLRKMTDADFQELCSEVERGNTEEGEAAALADFRQSGRLAMIEQLENAKPMSEKDLNWLEGALEKIQTLSGRECVRN